MALKYIAVSALAFALLFLAPVAAPPPVTLSTNLTAWAAPAVFVQYTNSTFYVNYTNATGCIRGSGVCTLQIPSVTGPKIPMQQSNISCYALSYNISTSNSTFWKIQCDSPGYDSQNYDNRTPTNILVSISFLDRNRSYAAPDSITLLNSTMADNSSGILSITQNSTLGGNIGTGVYDILFNWLSRGIKVRLNGLNAQDSANLAGYAQADNYTSSSDVANISVSKRYFVNISFRQFANYSITIAAQPGLRWYKCLNPPCNSSAWSRIWNFTEFQENSINYVRFNFNSSDPEIQGGVCTENWSCTSWSSCSGNAQTRTCSDANACGTTSNKPAESQSCGTAASAPAVSSAVSSSSQCTPEIKLSAAKELSYVSGIKIADSAVIKNTGSCSLYNIVINLDAPENWHAKEIKIDALAPGESKYFLMDYVLPFDASGKYNLNLLAASESASAGTEINIIVSPNPARADIIIGGPVTLSAETENTNVPQSPMTGAAIAEIPANRQLAGIALLAFAAILTAWKALASKKFRKLFR